MAPSRPPQVRVQSAKAIIKDGVELWLKECARCGIEFYGSPENSICNECKGKKKSRLKSA
jgi:hypothetical protein